MKSLTVIMTALNEQDNIQLAVAQMYEALQARLESFKIVVINDGSTDKTASILNEIKLPHLEIVHNPVNLGTGKSIRNYLPNITTDYYCWYPTDLELAPSEITKALDLMNDHDVIVSYLIGDQRNSLRRMLSKTFTHILNLTFGKNLPYYNGVSLIRRELLPSGNLLSSRRFFTHAEILILSLRDDTKVSSVGLNLYPRHSGESKAMRLDAFMDVGVNFIKLMSKKMRQ